MRILITILLLSSTLVFAETITKKDGLLVETVSKEISVNPQALNAQCLSDYAARILYLQEQVSKSQSELTLLLDKQNKCLTVASSLKKAVEGKATNINWQDVRTFAGVNWSDNSVISQ